MWFHWSFGATSHNNNYTHLRLDHPQAVTLRGCFLIFRRVDHPGRGDFGRSKGRAHPFLDISDLKHIKVHLLTLTVQERSVTIHKPMAINRRLIRIRDRARTFLCFLRFWWMFKSFRVAWIIMTANADQLRRMIDSVKEIKAERT